MNKRKLIWKISKVFLQFLLVIVLIVFLARVNYLPVLVPDSWQEWIIDTTDKWFENQGLGKISQFTQNLISLKFFDRNAKENEVLIQNQKKNFINLLNEINENLNKVAGSFEVLLSLSGDEADFNVARANYYLNTLINNTSDYDAFLIWDTVNKKFVINTAIEGYNPEIATFTKLAEKIEYEKLAKLSSPVIFFRDNKLVMAYAFKGDTLEEKGILFTVLSTHFFKRDLSVLRGKKFFNYVFYKNKLVYLRKNKKDIKNYNLLMKYSKSESYNDYFRGKKSIFPKLSYRISARNFIINNPLFSGERVQVNIGIVYPKSVLISIILNILLILLLIFGLYVIYKMYFHVKEAYYSYSRLKEAPFLLLDDTLNKMSKVFDKMVGSTKRIKTNVDRQREVANRLLEIAPPKAIGYEEKEKKESYGFVSNDENNENSESEQ